MVYRVVFSLRAQRDLREIKRYISRGSSQAAERFGRLLITKTIILATHPEIGRRLPGSKDVAVREIIVKNYRVIYEIDFSKEKVEIIRYWHAARGIPDIIF